VEQSSLREDYAMGKDKKYIVTASSLNIRPVPGTYYEPVGSVAHGEKIISPDIEGWIPILLEDDTIGWVAGKYLQEASAGVPEPEEAEKPAPGGPQVGVPFLQNELTGMFGAPDYHQFARKYLVNIDLSEFADSLAHVRTSTASRSPQSMAINSWQNPSSWPCAWSVNGVEPRN
jgi:uncharacterized protein YgiM (DUF1202 family)